MWGTHEPCCRPPSRREPDELGSPVLGVGDPPDVAALLELVHQEHHSLFRDPRSLGQLGEAGPGPPVDRHEQCGVTRTDVRVASLVEALQELPAEGPMGLEQEPGQGRFHALILPDGGGTRQSG